MIGILLALFLLLVAAATAATATLALGALAALAATTTATLIAEGLLLRRRAAATIVALALLELVGPGPPGLPNFFCFWPPPWSSSRLPCLNWSGRQDRPARRSLLLLS